MESRENETQSRAKKRQMSEKRRSQNRVAQRAYRAKRKTEMQSLQQGLEDSDGKMSNDLITSLKHMLQVENEKGVDELLSFAVRHRPNLKDIVLAGLRTLKAEKNATLSHKPNVILFPTTPENTENCPETFIYLPWPVPSPLASRMFCRQESLRENFYQNAQFLGLEWENIHRPTCLSPWNSPFASSPALVATEDIPHDLHPTKAQRSIPHHAYIDLIPFPKIREATITIATRDRCSHMELKADMLDGGISCWKARSRGIHRSWDKTTWEIEPWFWNKWGWMIKAEQP